MVVAPEGRAGAAQSPGRTSSTSLPPVSSRAVVCCYCGRPIDVPVKAMSGSCPFCHKRIVLEHVKITSYKAVKNHDTCGAVTIEKRGHLVASRVLAESLTVRGQLRGNVMVRNRVEIEEGGILNGDVTAPVIVVRPGGLLNGHCCIGEGGQPDGAEQSTDNGPSSSAKR